MYEVRKNYTNKNKKKSLYKQTANSKEDNAFHLLVSY